MQTPDFKKKKGSRLEEKKKCQPVMKSVKKKGVGRLVKKVNTRG